MDTKINRVSLRHERKKYSQLRKVANHNHRKGDYDKSHIDPEKSHLNKVLFQRYETTSLIEQVNNRIAELPENQQPKINKNQNSQNESVVVMEIMISASPEFFENASDTDIEKWAKLNTEAARKRFGDNLLEVVLHLDEKTPHLHVCTMPLELTQKKKRLGKKQKAAGVEQQYYETYSFNAKKLFNSESLKANQTYFAEAVKDMGIERGIENSKAVRTTIREYHNSLKENLKKIDDDVELFTKNIDKIKLPNQNHSKYNKSKMFSKVFDSALYIKDLATRFKKLKREIKETFKDMKITLNSVRQDRDRFYAVIEKLNEICDNDHEQLSTKFDQMRSEINHLKETNKELEKTKSNYEALQASVSEKELQATNDAKAERKALRQAERALESSDKYSKPLNR